MKSFFLILLGLFAVISGASAQNLRTAQRATHTTVATNAWVAWTNSTQVFSIIVQNSSATDLWMHVYDSRTNKLNNTTAEFAPLIIPGGQFGGYDWGPSGCPFRSGVLVMVSTTDRTLTNGSAVFNMSVVHTP